MNHGATCALLPSDESVVSIERGDDGTGADSTSTADACDREVLRRIAQNGDVSALEDLYQRYRPRLAGFLRRLIDNQAEIDEIYNDIMHAVWKSAHQYAGNAKVSSWIFAIAYRHFLKRVRKSSRRAALWEKAPMDESEPENFLPVAAIESEQLIHMALKHLSIDQRLVVELCYFEGCTFDEIAEIAECPVNTVKTRMFHARKKLRNIVETLSQPVESTAP